MEIAEKKSNTQDLPLVVGVDLGGAQARAAVMRNKDLLTNPINEPVEEDQPPDRIISLIRSIVEQALKEANTSLDQVAGIGVGVPAPANVDTGEVFQSPNLQRWKRLPLRDRLVEAFQPYAPHIFIDNDANAGALGEYLFGAGRGTRNMVYLTISTGVGGGVIVNGQIMRGANGAAAELGHMIIYGDSERPNYCRCGNIGCLESIVSGRAISERVKRTRSARQELSDEDDEHSLTDVLRFTDRMADDDEVSEAIETAARALSIGFINIIHIFNPEMIILGGSVDLLLKSRLLSLAKQQLDSRLADTEHIVSTFMKVPRITVKIQPAALNNIGLIGAGALVYYMLGYVGSR